MALALIILFFITTFISFGFNSACIPGERNALLQFKNKFNDDSGRLESWATSNTNCCKWYGVICSNITGKVSELHLGNLPSTSPDDEISSSFLDLKELRYLDLSNHIFGLNPIPSFLGSLKSLTFLNLSKSTFDGMIPPELGNLSNLRYLNLDSASTYSDSLDWLSGLSKLEFLDLSNVNLGESSDWLEKINKLHSLVELHLSGCNLVEISPLVKLNLSSLLVLDLGRNWFKGPIPNQLQKLSSIKELDLSANHFNSSIPDWFYNFKYLEILNLGMNQLKGQISSSIENLTSLTSLDMSSNLEFDGGIPRSFKNLCNLRSLSFSRTKLSQEINEILDIFQSGCPKNVLESLDLHDCGLSGELGNQLGKLKNLIYLRLSSNFISGAIPILAPKETMPLRFLFLDNNKLGGTLPEWLGELPELANVNISYNLLQGKVLEIHFANLTKLRRFDGSMNQLTLEVSSNWIPPFRSLRILRLRSWGIGAKFSSWLHSLKHVYDLDLSSSSISSTIPNWFWNYSSSRFLHLNLSHNQIHGTIPDIPNIALPFSEIDLSSNQFEGSLPIISTGVRVLDVSNNSFSGSISNLLCYKTDEQKVTMILNLDNNLLTGEMSDCWTSWTYLQLIRLSSNNLSGNIPESIGLENLMYLHLRNYSLSGELPLSLSACQFLITLDLGENKLTGRIPEWLGTEFNYLSILSLRGNNFNGHMPEEICHSMSLQILDLAHNNLSGIIPNCFNFFKFMATTDSRSPEFFYYIGDGHVQWDESILLMKGKIVEYDRILMYVKIMDLSSNKFSGEIPVEFLYLIALQSLNLSNNFLSGVMKGLESLDFSRNHLSGRIPQSMTSLTFLSMLNLSYNNLSGWIPTGTQLQSFPAESFIGNEGLRGAPLTGNGSVPVPVPDSSQF